MSAVGEGNFGASEEAVVIACGMTGMSEEQQTVFNFIGALRPRPTK